MEITRKLETTLLLTALWLLPQCPTVAQDFSSHWGINAHVPSPAEMDKLVECGVTWFRADFPTSDNYVWSTWEQLVTEIRARRLEIFATIFPSWAGEPPGGGWDRWQDFVYRIVSHFKESVYYWGIGNEINSDSRWTLDQYVELVKRAYAGAKRADSTSQIVAPAFYYGGQWKQQLAYFLDHAVNLVDVIDHHYYRENIPTAKVVLEEVDVTQQILDAHGAADKPFWITETGLPSKTTGEEVQADFFTEMCDGVAARPWIEKIFFDDFVDNPGEHPTLWGILRNDHSPKPAFFAYQAAIVAYNKPLLISSSFPRTASQQVPLNQVMAIEFSRGVNQESVVNSISAIPSVDFTSDWSVHSLSILPTTRLSPLTTYNVKVSATAVSIGGDGLDGNGNGVYEGSPADDFSFSFTTDTSGTLPKVISTSPEQGAVHVVAGSALRLTFQQPMDVASVESAFSISSAISGFLTWMNQKVADFFRFGALKPGSFYTLRVKSRSKDQWGYPLDGNGNGKQDAEDDFVLYFATVGKGAEIFYPVTGEFPLDFFGASVGTSKDAAVTLPDTVQVQKLQSGKLRLLTKGVDDTTEAHIYINGNGPLLLSTEAVGGDNSNLSDLSFTGSLLKTSENEIRFELAKDLGGSQIGFQVVPMALVTSYATAVSARDHSGNVPVAFFLEQNYPNPFNSVTEICFGVPAQSMVELEIFNVLGQA